MPSYAGTPIIPRTYRVAKALPEPRLPVYMSEVDC